MYCGKCGKQNPEDANVCANCGNMLKQVNTETQTVQTLKLVFQRRKKILGFAIPVKVYVDDKQVASLANGANFEMDITSGKHTIIFDTGGEINKQELEFEPEYKKITIYIILKMGMVTGLPVIDNIEKE